MNLREEAKAFLDGPFREAEGAEAEEMVLAELLERVAAGGMRAVRRTRLQRAFHRVVVASAEHHGVDAADVYRPRARERSVVAAKRVALYVGRMTLGFSYPGLATVYGQKDHTTVMDAVRAVSAGLQAGFPGLAEAVAVVAAAAAAEE